MRGHNNWRFTSLTPFDPYMPSNLTSYLPEVGTNLRTRPSQPLRSAEPLSPWRITRSPGEKTSHDRMLDVAEASLSDRNANNSRSHVLGSGVGNPLDDRVEDGPRHSHVQQYDPHAPLCDGNAEEAGVDLVAFPEHGAKGIVSSLQSR